MPVYLYRCRDCGQKVEVVRAIKAKDIGRTCPSCSTGELKKLIMPFYENIPKSPGESTSFG
jgi:putative FmdB family regulatory protein